MRKVKITRLVIHAPVVCQLLPQPVVISKHSMYSSFLTSTVISERG